MEKKKLKILLLLGCQRSGTSLLTAMLGRHSEINMLYESNTKDVFKAMGKKYSGNKLLAWRQIRKNQRSSKFGHLINKLVNFDFSKTRKHHKIRIYPTSILSIKDYIDNGAAIITITRSKDEVVNSITSRTEMSRIQAIKEYDLSMKEIQSVKNNAINITFSELVNSPIDTLKAICSQLGLEYEPRMLEGTKYNYVYPNEKIISDKDKTNLQPTKINAIKTGVYSNR